MPDKSGFTVVVRMPNWLGDCVMAFPAVRHLVDVLPKARVYLAGREQFAELFRAQKGVAGFVSTPASGFGKLLKGMSETKRILRDSGVPAGVDMGVLFTNSLSTAAWMWRTGAASRLGYDLDCRRFFLTHPIPCGGLESGWHFVRYYLWLAKCAEAVAFESERVSRRQVEPMADYLAPSMRVRDGARTEAATLLATEGVTGDYVVIAPASAYGAVKDWPPGHWRKLIEMLRAELGVPVVVTGAGSQADVCQEVVEGQGKGVVNLAGKTGLDVFSGVLAGADGFVGGDSGGAHVAGALGVPSVVIFGVTDPVRTCPGGEAVQILGGCAGSGLKLSSPEARRQAKDVLASITPETVFSALVSMREKKVAAESQK